MNMNSKVIIKKGTVWSPLIVDGTQVGIAYSGKIDFIIDAIIETIDGAIGSTIDDTLEGLGIAIGSLDQIKERSKKLIEKSEYTMAFETMLELLQEKKSTIDINFDDPFHFSVIDRQMKHIFASTRVSTVYIKHRQVLTLTKTKMTRISEDGILIAKRYGKIIRIQKRMVPWHLQYL